MSKPSKIHDAAYKAFFADPKIVGSLLKGFLPDDLVNQMNLRSLSPWPA